MNNLVVHRAKWVVPVSRPTIQNGAVAVRDSRIVGLGKFHEVRALGNTIVVDHGEAALVPGLVNTHTHLELSFLRELGKKKNEGGFIGWVRELLKARSEIDSHPIRQSYREALVNLFQSGTVAVGDVGNDFSVYRLLKDFSGISVFFLEALGFALGSLDEVFRDRKDVEELIKNEMEPQDSSSVLNLSAHAVYSTSPVLIWEVKEWNRKRGKLMSIHVAEHEEEVEFLMTGQGPCKELLEERGQWSSSWSPPLCSPVKYLDKLGVLDESTLAVHLVYVNDEDLSILTRNKVAVSVCVRSNKYISGKLPPVKKFLENGLLCGLGTDSLASTSDLNLFNEMHVIVNKCGIHPEDALKMGTINGARILGIHLEVGSLEVGKKAFLLKVPLRTSLVKEVYPELIARGRAGDVQWIEQTRV